MPVASVYSVHDVRAGSCLDSADTDTTYLGMIPQNASLASEPLRTLPDMLNRSRIATKYFSLLLSDAYASHYPRPVHPSRARIRRVELRKENSGARCEYLLLFVTLDGRPWTEAPLGVIICERNVLSEDRDPMTPEPIPTTRVAYWLYLASSLYNFLRGGLPPYNGDHIRLYSPNQVLRLRGFQRSWMLYRHEYTTLPAAGPVDVTEPQPEFPHWSRDATVPPTVFHLAAAASLLDKLQPEYIASDRQCFWYTAMLYYLLVDRDALDAEVEHDAKRVTIGDAYWPEAARGKSTFASSSTFRAHPGTFRGLFQRVTRKDIEELRTEEKLDDMACEARLAELYSGLRDALFEDRERYGSWGPLAVPGKEAAIRALGGTILDMQLEVQRDANRKWLEADRIATAIKLEAQRAAAVKKLEAETAAAIREYEESAAAARKFKAQKIAALEELDAEKAAALKELDAKMIRLGAETAAAKEREEAAVAKCKQMEEDLAALTAAHAAALARYPELERRAGSEA